MTPTLRQLEYLVAVSRTLNFRQAAEDCLVSQPALSAQIQQLETTLGVRLFERDKRRVLLTEPGRELAERAQQVLREVDDLVAAVSRFHEPLTGPLRLGVIPTIAPYLLPRAIPAAAAAYPDLQLFLREDQTAELVRRLEDGDLDVLLLALEADLGDCETIRLFEDPFLVACAPGHPFARLGEVGEADLAAEELLLLEEGHCLRSQALSFCDRAGVEEFAAFEASSLSTLVQMVACGLGVTLLPEMAADIEGRAADIVVKPVADPAPSRTIGLAWRRSSPRKSEFECLAEVLAVA